MKFVFATLLIVVSLAGCAGCGSSDEDSTNTNSHGPSSAQTNPQQTHQDQNAPVDNSSGTGGVPGDSQLTSSSNSVTQPTIKQSSSIVFAAPVSNSETAEITLDDLDCGGSPVKVAVRMSRPKNHHDDGSERYVLLVGDHTAIEDQTGPTFFEDIDHGAKALVELLSKKNRIIQIAYPDHKQCGKAFRNGLVSACCGKGMKALIKHNDDLIKKIMEVSGYHHSTNPKKKISAIGFGFGTLQLSTMAFQSGVRFDHLALVSPVYGDIENGCKDLGSITRDSFTIPGFAPKKIVDFSKLFQLINLGASLDALSLSGHGCTQYSDDASPEHTYDLEYSGDLDIDRLQYFTNFFQNFDPLTNKSAPNGKMAVFEGKNNFDITEYEKVPASGVNYVSNLTLQSLYKYVGVGAAISTYVMPKPRVGASAVEVDRYSRVVDWLQANILANAVIFTADYIWYTTKRWIANGLGKFVGHTLASGYKYNPAEYIAAKHPTGADFMYRLYEGCGETIWEYPEGQRLNYDIMYSFSNGYVDPSDLKREKAWVDWLKEKKQPVLHREPTLTIHDDL